MYSAAAGSVIVVIVGQLAQSADWRIGADILSKNTRLWSSLPVLAVLLGVICAPLASSEPSDRPMTFVWLPTQGDEGAVIASGTITSETRAAFDSFVSSHSPAAGAEVILSSNGGDLKAGLALGRRIRELGFATNIGEVARSGPNAGEVRASRCSSACALMFLGGVERQLIPGSEYGVHQLRLDCVERWRAQTEYPWLPVRGARYCPEFEEAMSAFQSAQGAVAGYVAEMGADPLLFSRMSDVTPADLQFLTASELKKYMVTTRETPPPISEGRNGN